MQLSSRVIKYNNVDEVGNKSIVTKEISLKRENDEVVYDSNRISEEERYRNIANMILEEARRKSEAILLKANIDAKNIEDEAYQKGYDVGNERGYLEGVQKGNLEASRIKEETITSAQVQASDIIFSAKEEYENYLLSKKEEILNLMLQISDSLFKEKIIDIHVIEKAIFEAIEASKNTESFIIKANKDICNNLKDNIDSFKKTLTFSTEIHLVEDTALENNKVIIEKSNGKTIIDFNGAYDNIVEVIKNL